MVELTLHYRQENYIVDTNKNIKTLKHILNKIR